MYKKGGTLKEEKCGKGKNIWDWNYLGGYVRCY